MAVPDAVRWALLSAPSLLLLNWIGVLLASAALVWQRREGSWPRWRALARLAAGLALHPRHRARTMLIAMQLLMLDLVAPLFVLLLLR